MEFKVEKKSIRVKIGDQAYEVKVPSVMQQKSLQAKLADGGQEKSIDIMTDHLIALGLPAEVINELDVDSFLELYEFIHMPKKKLATSN